MKRATLRELFDPQAFLSSRQAREGVITLSHRRIYIVPNRRGFGLGLLLLIEWLTSINYNSNLGFILTFLLVAVALLDLLHGYRNLAGLRIHPRRGQPVFAGEIAGLELHIANPTPLARYALWFSAQHAEPVRADLAADAATTATLGLKTTRRGWLEPGTLRVYSEFPLGLHYAWSLLRFKERILVYPTPAADSLPFPIATGFGRATGRLQAGSAEDFHGFQAYQAGDPLRHIHWKGVAKGLDPQVKRYTGEQADELILAYEDTPGEHSEARLSRLCRWVLDAENLGLRYALHLPGTQFASNTGTDHCRRCLEALALCEL